MIDSIFERLGGNAVSFVEKMACARLPGKWSCTVKVEMQDDLHFLVHGD
jgi:hypothetical protein